MEAGKLKSKDKLKLRMSPRKHGIARLDSIFLDEMTTKALMENPALLKRKSTLLKEDPYLKFMEKIEEGYSAQS